MCLCVVCTPRATNLFYQSNSPDDTTTARTSKFNDLYDSIVSPVKQKLSLEDLFEMGKQRKYGPLDFMWHPQQAGSSKQPRIFVKTSVPEDSWNNMKSGDLPDQVRCDYSSR